MHNILVRDYQQGDAAVLAAIYYHTIHCINSSDYTETQIHAWAPASSLDPVGWQKKWETLPPFVAVADVQVVGFAELEENGHIDCFYCHHEWIGKGVGSALMTRIEAQAAEKKIARLFAEVSITAKPFFERKGFAVLKEQTVRLRDVELTNFVMEKNI
jgi:putative acetyltransferase